MNSTIEITFSSVPALDTVFAFTDSLTGMTITETFKDARTGIGESLRDSSSLQLTTNNYRNALNLDYNINNLYQISYFADVDSDWIVFITANNAQSQFTLSTNTTSGAISAVINNSTINTFTIDSVTISEADSSPCDNVKFTVNTSETATNITTPISQAVSTNPFVFDHTRSDVATKITMNKDTVVDTNSSLVPRLLAVDFDVNVANTPTTATVNVTRNTSAGLLIFEYSLDGSTWQSSSNFPNLEVGDYTMHIRDNIGCSITKSFSVTSFSPTINNYSAIAEVSNLNPIRYKEVVNWTNCGVQKNVDNTLSYEEEVWLNRRDFKQKFQLCDTPPTQIKTNYKTVTAKIIDCNGTETALTVEKKTDFIDQTDVRDATVTSIEINNSNGYDGYLGLFFPPGNTYDPITLQQNGTYNSGLPSWIDIDEYVNIQGFGWFRVLDIISGTNGGRVVLDELYANSGFGAPPQNIIVTSYYNIQDYERHEFAVDFSNFTEGNYQVQIDLQDDTFGTKQYLSEWIDLRECHENCHVIKYYHTELNEINFSYGFRGILRVPYVLNLKYKPNEEQDVYVDDNNTVLLDTRIRRFNDFNLRPLPTAMAEKLALVTSQDRLFINDIGYLKIGELDTESLGTTNLYKVKGTLTKADYVYSNTEGVQSDLDITGDGLSLQSGDGILLNG
ncbi:hypothetical protein [uncultured Winogradskyella sp.]|uniref:hypothetical protein n=1 Tax=uncultured Winogradskyella sp. TaxID=395353 RepID=UPI00260ADB83|nr:hypothetical protein [uncultured Winogradskyella sp.]